MFCDHCGGTNRDGARFCRACGALLAAEKAPDTPTMELPKGRTPGGSVPSEVREALREQYVVERLLGRGGMGAVYLARESALDRLVAIKVLEVAARDDDKAIQRFVREARLAARLRHPHIVSVHGIGQSGRIHYFTMDYIDGETLDAHVRRTAPLPVDRWREFFYAISGAVGHAHANGVIHRDLKPQNVMLDRDGHVLVMDFGLAKGEAHTGITTSGIVIGTPQYMSPEQLEGKPATARSDVYALGLLLFFLLTGDDLVKGESISSVVAQHLGGTPVAQVEKDTRIPEALRPQLLALLHRNPAKRPASAHDVLGHFFPEQGSPAARGGATVPLPPAPDGAAPSKPLPPLSPARKEARIRIKTLLDRMPRKEQS